MKVGGNGAATEYFSKNGGNGLLMPGTEGKIKYTSAVARSYKEELNKRGLADAKRQPLGSQVYFPGIFSSNSSEAAGGNGSAADSTSANGKAGGKDDGEDFFDDWDDAPKKAAPASAKPPQSASGGLPGIGKARPTAAATAAPPKPAAAPKPAARPAAIMSSSNDVSPAGSGTSTPTGTSSTGGVRRLGGLGAIRASGAGGGASGSSSSGGLGGKARLGGVKKAAPAAFNFEEAEKRARAEEERKRKEEAEAIANAAISSATSTKEEKGGEGSKSTAEELARKAVQAAMVSTGNDASPRHNTFDGKQRTAGGTPTSPNSAKKATAQEVERLGMGFGKLGLKAEKVRMQNESDRRGAQSKTQAEDVTYARSKFGGQKGEFAVLTAMDES